jgi:hypothetical protein
LKHRLKFCLGLVASLVAAVTLATAAYATYYVTYGGPKTWLPGYDAHGAYDVAGDRWAWNEFRNRSVNSWAQIALIDGGGGWHGSYQCWGTYCGRGVDPWNFSKKPFCENTDTITYTGECRAERGY